MLIEVRRGGLLSRELGRALDRGALSNQDRSFVTDLVYGTARWRIWLDAALAPHLRAPEKLPRAVREVLRLGAYELLKRGTPPHAAVHAWVRVARATAPSLHGLVNAVLRKVEAPAHPDPATRGAVPTWLWREIEGALGHDADTAIEAMRAPAPLWLADLGPASASSLRDEGCEVTEGPVPSSLAVRSPKRLGDLHAFERGWVQPMNPASLLVARLAAPAAGETVLDLCAGRGVKSAILAHLGARVVSVEVDAAKVAQAERNLSRLHLAVEHHVHDLTRIPTGLEPASHVLIDAPCSGTGTLRGHPEIVERLTEEDVARLARLQGLLLDHAVAMTAKGGTLTYAVCSLTKQEGPDVIRAALARHSELAVEPPDAWNTPAAVPTHPVDMGAFLLPTAGLDGFFVARLKRSAR